ncbi:hypothetical protein ACFPN2_08940 [Steroidobacter flavus]|uniref:Uncharacterized protein n=1 Tax=Steroidobacter flavus TaxID=1842136 RepID=A0ABV8SRK9_9GAMM
MRLIKLAWAVAALGVSWAVSANPAINSNVTGSIAGPAVATTQMVAGQAQVRLDGTGLGGSGLSGKDARIAPESSAGSMDDSMSRGWLMALVTVLLIGHQLRRKHRFLRPQRFSDL